MTMIFSSGAQLDANGQFVPVVDAPVVADPPPPASTEPATPPDAAQPVADGEPPAPAEPAESEEEAAVSEQSPRPTRPFVARTIRENERLRRDLAAQAAQIEYLTRQLTPSPATPPPQPGPVPPSPPDPARPRPELYPSHEDYVEALTDWKYDQRDRQREAAVAQQREAVQRQTAQQQWAQREQEGRDTYDDYDEVVSRLSLRETVAPIVADTFRESEQGHALLYYLGQHPRDVQHLNSLTPLAAARWLGQLETRLGPPAPPARGPTPPPARGPGSGPPATTPIAPVGTGGTVPLPGYRPGMSLQDYERMRLQERGNRP